MCILYIHLYNTKASHKTQNPRTQIPDSPHIYSTPPPSKVPFISSATFYNITLLFPELVNKLEAESPPCSLVPVNRGRQKHQVRPQQLLHQRQRDSRGLIDRQQLAVGQLFTVQVETTAAKQRQDPQERKESEKKNEHASERTYTTAVRGYIVFYHPNQSAVICSTVGYATFCRSVNGRKQINLYITYLQYVVIATTIKERPR